MKGKVKGIQGKENMNKDTNEKYCAINGEWQYKTERDETKGRQGPNRGDAMLRRLDQML